MATSWEKSLATIQEAQIAVSEVLGRLRFNTATFRGWNKVQATGRHLRPSSDVVLLRCRTKFRN